MLEGVDYRIAVTIDTVTYDVTYELWEGNYRHRIATHRMPPAHRGAFVNGLAAATFTVTGDNALPSVYRVSNWTLTWPTTAPAEWDVNFDINYTGGTSPNPISVAQGSAVTLPTVTRSGYSFNGWFTAAVDGTRVGGAGDSFTPDANVTLYAQWAFRNVIQIPLGTDPRHVLYYFRDLQDGQSIVFDQRNGQNVLRGDRANGQTVIQVWPAATHTVTGEIAIAFYALRPGDTLYFHEGQYGRLPWVWTATGGHNASLAEINNPTMSGAPGSPITISGYPGGVRPRISQDVPGSGQTTGPLLWTTGSHLDITFLEFGNPGTWQHMLRVGGVNNRFMTQVSVTNVHFIGTTQGDGFGSGQALAVNAGSVNSDIDGFLIAYNTFLNTRATKIYIGDHGGRSRGRDIVVRDNFMCGAGMMRPDPTGSSAFGMQMKQGMTGLVENNLWINTRGPSIMVHGSSDTSMRGWTRETIVRNNIVVGMYNLYGCRWQQPPHHPTLGNSWADPVWYYYDWYWYEGVGIYVGGGVTSVYNNIALDSGSGGIKIEAFFIRRPGDLIGGATDNLFNNIDVRNNTTGHNRTPFRDFADYSQDEFLPGTGYQTRWDDTVVRRRTNNTTQAHLDIFVEDNIYHCSTETSDLLADMILDIRAFRAMPDTAAAFFAATAANPGPYTESELINKLAILLGIEDELVTVDFNINFTGGTNPETQIVVEGDHVTLPAVTRPNYTFNGWFTAAVDGTLVGLAGAQFTPNADVTLFAQWTAVPQHSNLMGSFTVITPVLAVRVALMQGSTEVDYRLVTAGAGNVFRFEFDDVAEGTYSLVFTRPGHTSVTVSNIVIVAGSDFDLATQPQFPDELQMFAGDLNGDGVIDAQDLALFTQMMAQRNLIADFNGDGVVNAVDRAVLMSNIGRRSIVIDLP